MLLCMHLCASARCLRCIPYITCLPALRETMHDEAMNDYEVDDYDNDTANDEESTVNGRAF